MQDTKKQVLIHLTNQDGRQVIHTSLTSEIREIILDEGIQIFEALQGHTLRLSDKGFSEVDHLISPP